MTLNDLEHQHWGVLVIFWRFSAAAHTTWVNCDELAGDRPRHCEQELLSLTRISWALL